MSALTIGLLSDTHIPHRMKSLPQEVCDALAGVDLILHAGDVDEPSALEPLRAIAPVYAVRGNWHITDFSSGGATLPSVIELRVSGWNIVLVHGHQPGPVGFLLKGLHVAALGVRLTSNSALNRRAASRLARLHPEADVIIFGHSHRAHIERRGKTLLVNPGAVCPSSNETPTVARLRLGEGKPEAEIIPLRVRRTSPRQR